MMVTSQVEGFVRQFERRVVVAVLRAHPEWSLEQLMCHRGEYQASLRALTISELRRLPLGLEVDRGGGPPVRVDCRELAERTTDREEFDAIVLEVLSEAVQPVRAGYVRARVGGPRWKVQYSLGRLSAAGKISRSGVTSDTQYCVLNS